MPSASSTRIVVLPQTDAPSQNDARGGCKFERRRSGTRPGSARSAVRNVVTFSISSRRMGLICIPDILPCSHPSAYSILQRHWPAYPQGPEVRLGDAGALANFPAAISSDEESLHCSLVPLDAYPWTIGNVNLTFLYPDGPLKNGACVVEVLETVGGRTRSQEVRAHFREDVARQREPRRLGQRGRPQPAGHAPDLHGVGHPVVAGAGLKALLQVVGAPPVLADADGGPGLLGDPGVALKVIGAGRLFDPPEPLLVEDTHPLEGSCHRE